jgi:hypothetical protein
VKAWRALWHTEWPTQCAKIPLRAFGGVSPMVRDRRRIGRPARQLQRPGRHFAREGVCICATSGPWRPAGASLRPAGGEWTGPAVGARREARGASMRVRGRGSARLAVSIRLLRWHLYE